MRYSQGFTLVELMITLAVLVIVLTFAVANFRSVIESNRLQAARDNLHSAILFAKGEAVSRNRRVSVCSSADGAACNAAVDWSQGWIVYEDDSLTSAATVVGTVLRRYEQSNQISVTYSPAGAPGFLHFQPNGISNLTVDATLGLCDPNSEVDAYSLLISRITAQIRRGSSSDANC